MPTLKSSDGRVSRPTANMSTITPIVATVASVSDGCTQPSSPGPMRMPASSSPMTAGCLNRSKTSPMTLPAAKTISSAMSTFDPSSMLESPFAGARTVSIRKNV